MSAMPIRLRDDHLTYRSWTEWRAWRARLPVRIEVRPCWACWQQGYVWHTIPRRMTGDMSRPCPSGRGYHLAVICQACGGRRVLETVVDVER